MQLGSASAKHAVQSGLRSSKVKLLMSGSSNVRTAIVSLVATTVTFIASSSFAAQTWTVGPDPIQFDFGDIQSAIDQASNGDTIMVAPGTYTGTGSGPVVDFKAKSLVIEGSHGLNKTVIDAENVRVGVRCQNTPEPSTLIGFTIRRGSAQLFNGGGLDVDSCTMGVVSCLFEDNHAYNGAGAYATDSLVVFSGCTFRDNLATSNGGGIGITNSSVYVVSSTIRDNSATWGGGIFAYSTSQPLRVYDTLFCHNFNSSYVINHMQFWPGATVEDKGLNEFYNDCPDNLAFLGLDLYLELIFYINIPPCDPLDEMAADVTPVDNPDEFIDPSAIEVAPDGNLAIVDRELGIVHGYSLGENTYEGALFQSDMMQQPVAIAFDAGFAYVADAAGMIHLFNASNGSPAGVLQGEMLAPVDLAVGTDGILWTSNANSAAPVQAWDPRSGEMLFAFSGEFPGFDVPGALTILPDGKLLVVDQADSEIYSFDWVTGAVESFLSAEEAEELGLGEIRSFKCLSDNRIYLLSDRGLSRFTRGGWFMGDIQDEEGMLANIAFFTALDPPPDPWKPADFNHDGVVDGADLAQLLGAWGGTLTEFDLTEDGIVNGADLASLLGSWG